MNGFIMGYLIMINIIAFFCSGYDKLCAIRHRCRVPEKTLLLFALALGGVGLYGSFLLFRHKIRKPKFMLGVPCIMAVQVLLYFLLKP